MTRLERLGRDLKNEGDPEKRKALEARKLALGEAVRIAKRLHRASPKTGAPQPSQDAVELATLDHLNERGASYSAKSVRAMLAQ